MLCLLVILAYSYFALQPVVYSINHTPPHLVYLGLDDYPLDMTGNMATVWQGYHGAWMRTSHFVNAADGPVGPPTPLKFEYILIGKFARLLLLDPYVTFYGSRFLIAIIHFFVIYGITIRLIKNKWERFVAFIFIFFSTGFSFPWIPEKENPSVKMVLEGHTFFRMYYGAHHYLMGSIFALLSLWLLSINLTHPKKKKYFFLALLFGLLLSWVYAPNTLMIITTLPFYLIFQGIAWLRKKISLTDLITQSAIIFFYSIVVLTPVLLVRFTISNVWDWNAYAVTEKIVPYLLSIPQYFMLMGLVYILSLLAVPRLIRSSDKLWLLILPWIVIHPLGVFLLRNFLEINVVRYFISLYFVIFGLLGAVGASVLATGIKKIPRVNLPKTAILLGIAAVVIVSGFQTYKDTYHFRYACFCLHDGYDYGYPRKTVMQGIHWLKENTYPSDIVLTLFYSGTLIPAFSGNKVYANWWYRLTEDAAYGKVLTPVVMFYQGYMWPEEAEEFLKRNKITYVFSDIEEKALSLREDKALVYEQLTEVYRNNDVTIYKVK